MRGLSREGRGRAWARRWYAVLLALGLFLGVLRFLETEEKPLVSLKIESPHPRCQ